MAVNDDDLLPDLHHLGSVVNEVDGQAEGLTLSEPRASLDV
jgi:hypothetical protein